MKERLAVLSVSFTVLIYMVITVAVAGLTAAFPAVSEDTLLLAVTLPNLTCIPAILATPLLLRRLSQKAVTVGGLALTLLGGGLCLLFPSSLAVLLGAAALMGFAYGVGSTMYPLLVNSHFSGQERVSLMGYCSGALQLGRLTATLIGGFLADLRWNYIYFTFVFVLAALVISLLWLPGSGRSSSVQAWSGSDVSSLKNGAVWRLGGLSILFAVVYFLSSTHASLYIEGYQLGTASVTGTLSSLTLVLSVGIACFYGRLPQKMRDATPVVVFAVMAAGYLLAGLVVSLPTITAALVGAAAGIALFNPWFMLQVNTAAGQASAPVATSMVLTMINIGYFISPYLSRALSALIGGGVSSMFLLMGGLSLILSGALFFRSVRRR